MNKSQHQSPSSVNVQSPQSPQTPSSVPSKSISEHKERMEPSAQVNVNNQLQQPNSQNTQNVNVNLYSAQTSSTSDSRMNEQFNMPSDIYSYYPYYLNYNSFALTQQDSSASLQSQTSQSPQQQVQQQLKQNYNSESLQSEDTTSTDENQWTDYITQYYSQFSTLQNYSYYPYYYYYSPYYYYYYYGLQQPTASQQQQQQQQQQQNLSSVSTSPFDQLSDDVITNIFSFLPDYLELAKMSEVCKRWKKISYRDALWEPLTTKYYLYQKGTVKKTDPFLPWRVFFRMMIEYEREYLANEFEAFEEQMAKLDLEEELKVYQELLNEQNIDQQDEEIFEDDEFFDEEDANEDTVSYYNAK